MRKRFVSGPKTMFVVLLLSNLTGTVGCVSFIAEKGIPVRRVPKELLAEPKANREAIDPALLRQDPPDEYILGPEDVLGVYSPLLIGKDLPPPVRLQSDRQTPVARGSGRSAQTSVGYPFPVRDDGTVQLPQLPGPVKVSGLTIRQAEEQIRQAYSESQILKDDNPNLIVSLLEKRTYQVLVIREDSELPASRTQRLSEIAISTKRGRGFAIDLIAYENDVLHALTETGGLPGVDAVNEIIVYRSRFADAKKRSELVAQIESQSIDPCKLPARFVGEPGISRIPLRLPPGQAPTVTKEDITLKSGDIVFVTSRETDVFYTGGALNGNQVPLPRDYDLDVLQAIALVGGPVGGGGVNFRAGNVGAGIGLFGSLQGGAIPPSRCVIVRQVAPAGQFAIQVDLKKALVDPRERILIQAGDLLVVTYTPLESAANLFLSTFPFNNAWTKFALR